jgi:protein-L-isoaspartate(D-aspartate) O-methyltransferase
VQAFAKVPRQDFLGPGLRKIPDFGMSDGLSYRTSEDADPTHLCHDVGVGIDPERNLNNGHSSSLAASLDALEIGEGDTVFHLGARVGYFSAIVAEVVGPGRCVVAMEVDADLTARDGSNLTPW